MLWLLLLYIARGIEEGSIGYFASDVGEIKKATLREEYHRAEKTVEGVEE